MHLAKLVEYADHVAVFQAAHLGVGGMHRQFRVGSRQFPERRSDCPLAGWRDKRQRKAVGGRVRLIPIQSQRRIGLELVGKEIDLPIGGIREDVDELNRRCSTGRSRRQSGPQTLPDCSWQRVQHAHRQLELPGWLVLFE